MPASGAYRGAMDNDGMHKFAYGHDAIFADLLRLAVPALAAELDFAQAELLPTSHVAVGDSRMREPSAEGAKSHPRMKQRQGDMMWRVPRRRDAIDGTPADLIAVVEFQSTVNSDMARRMREYCQMARENPAVRRPGKEPPAQLPLVVYNGSERWTAPGAVPDLSAWSAAARLTLAPVQHWDYVLMSLERLLATGGGGLAHLPAANRAAATLRLQAERTPAELLARLREEWVRFPGAADRATRNVLYAWAGALLEGMGADLALPSVDELAGKGPNGGKNMATVSEARLGKWFEDVRAEHMALGRAEGIEQGRAEGIAEGAVTQRTGLRRQAAVRFGDAARRLDPLLDEVRSTAKLAEIGVWLMVDTIDELIAKVEAAAAADRVR